MRVTNEQRDTMRQIHSLALAADDCGIRVSVNLNTHKYCVWHDLCVSRGDEFLHMSAVSIDEKGEYCSFIKSEPVTLEQQRDTLATLIAEARKEAA